VAEENTTDSTPTPTDPNPTPAEGSTSSTTEQTPAAETGGEETGTILTGSEADTAADKAGDGTGDTSKGPTEEEQAKAELFGVPEGDYKLEDLPEGTVVDENALKAIEPVAKELGLSNKGLSKIAGVYAEKVLPAVVDQFTESLQRDVAAQHATWATETTELVKTDPVFQNKPLPEVQQVAAKALDRFGGEGFRKFLNDTGLGNHPDMVKFAYLAGSAISEDTSFERGGAAPKPKSRVEKYYGS
jgi:hypothetical protein